MTLPPLLRVRLRLRAPLGTPLTSGTIFGHLCWAVRERDGEQALERWLAAQHEEPTLISDGLPAGMLPRPLLSPASRQDFKDVEEAMRAKSRARLPWLPVARFLALDGRLDPDRIGESLTDVVATGGFADVRLAHNTIDRRTGTTMASGGLFFVDEDWGHVALPERDIYVRSARPATEIGELLGSVGCDGFGRDATWGRGRFDVIDVQPATKLDGVAGERWLSLSHGTITAAMQAPRYRLTTHFGKLGEVMARRGFRPWKRPILLARPGATFAGRGDGTFGALLADVHQDAPWIRHDARHVAIRYSEVERR